MPCRDPGYEDYLLIEREEKFQNLTRMLCAVMKKVDRPGKDSAKDLRERIYKTRGLQEWWEEHQRVDKAQREMEKWEADHDRKQKELLARLTKEERELLGYYD